MEEPAGDSGSCGRRRRKGMVAAARPPHPHGVLLLLHLDGLGDARALLAQPLPRIPAHGAHEPLSKAPRALGLHHTAWQVSRRELHFAAKLANASFRSGGARVIAQPLLCKKLAVQQAIVQTALACMSVKAAAAPSTQHTPSSQCLHLIRLSSCPFASFNSSFTNSDHSCESPRRYLPGQPIRWFLQPCCAP